MCWIKTYTVWCYTFIRVYFFDYLRVCFSWLCCYTSHLSGFYCHVQGLWGFGLSFTADCHLTLRLFFSWRHVGATVGPNQALSPPFFLYASTEAHSSGCNLCSNYFGEACSRGLMSEYPSPACWSAEGILFPSDPAYLPSIPWGPPGDALFRGEAPPRMY